MLGKSGVDDHTDEIAVSSDGSEVYVTTAHCTYDSTNYNCEGLMARLIVSSESLAWQKKIEASDPALYQAIYATDVELHDNDAYFSFMYLAKCLIIVLDTSGTEIAKKQFGVSGETDIIAELVFTSSSLFIFGSFTGSTYQAGASPSHYLYKTQADFADGASCTQLPITTSEVTLSAGDLVFTSSAAILNLVSQTLSASVSAMTTSTYSLSATELCFQDVVPFSLEDKSMITDEVINFSVGPFCSQRGLDLTITAVQ